MTDTQSHPKPAKLRIPGSWDQIYIDYAKHFKYVIPFGTLWNFRKHIHLIAKDEETEAQKSYIIFLGSVTPDWTGTKRL